MEKELNPGTVETIRLLLTTQQEFQPAWLERYFPEAAKKGGVGYQEVEKMTLTQAQAVRHLLIEQIIYARKQMRRSRGRGGGHGQGAPDEGDEGSEWPIRAELDNEALKDLCAAFGLAYPSSMAAEG